jgi:adenylate kinase family enzyme
MRRIVIVGPWGAGKSQLAAALARTLGAPLIEQDALYWSAGWVPTSTDEFRARVTAATGGDAWVADGNFSSARDIVWARADAMVWLDYGLPLVFWRLARRQIRRVATRQVLWHGNRERIGDLVGPGSLSDAERWLRRATQRRTRRCPDG